MKRLGPQAFERARRFLETEARPLERALFAFRFGGGSAEEVREQLSRYANDDGGFGHALEPDVRTPSSSALATALALKTLREIESPADDPLVRGAVDWAVSALDPGDLVWRVVPPDTNDHPHAPWWHDEDGSLARTFDDFRIIPRALLVGLLHHFGKHLPSAWLDAVTELTVRTVEAIDVLGEGGGSDLEYVVDLVQTEALPDRFRKRLLTPVRASVWACVVRDPVLWGTYCVTPLRAVPTPSSIGAEEVEYELPLNLDFLIDQQSAEGAWGPTWAWEYLAEMAVARREWRGILTLDALTKLKAFGRIDPT